MFSSFFIEGSLILHHIHLFKFLKRLNGFKKRRQKRDGLKRTKTPTQNPQSNTWSNACSNPNSSWFKRTRKSFRTRLKKRGMGLDLYF